MLRWARRVSSDLKPTQGHIRHQAHRPLQVISLRQKYVDLVEYTQLFPIKILDSSLWNTIGTPLKILVLMDFKNIFNVGVHFRTHSNIYVPMDACSTWPAFSTFSLNYEGGCSVVKAVRQWVVEVGGRNSRGAHQQLRSLRSSWTKVGAEPGLLHRVCWQRMSYNYEVEEIHIPCLLNCKPTLSVG